MLSPPSLQHLDKLNGRIKRMERLLDDLLAYCVPAALTNRLSASIRAACCKKQLNYSTCRKASK